ncbi:hypothetical protein LTR53_001200 [Teratosphaeriaceae sp. CCFEE 6253]|nr:hypothetical protein LTR53_001200 [Teratosphaeriaceae sp. CCFEE 6253]
MDLLTLEGGKPRSVAAFEVDFVLRWFKYHLTLALDEERVELQDRTLVTRYTPLGVVAAICPWNFPLVLTIGKVLPALLTGCCVIVKPSPFTPYTTLKIVEIALDIFPPGVFQGLNGDDSLGPAMVTHPDIAKISFTGSVPTGMKIMEQSGSTLKRITLELGGNDAAIILPDVDISKVAKQIVSSALLNAGQMCVATKRVYIHTSIYERFVAAAVDAMQEVIAGHPDSREATMGPIQNKPQYDRVIALLEDSKTHGYTLRAGKQIAENLEGGLFVQPTLVDNPPDSSRVVVKEAFGPIFPTLKWTDTEELLARVNATETGLGASVWSSNVENASAIARRLEVGSVWINMIETPIPDAYFSGHKRSGIGGEWGKYGWRAYCNAQVIHTMKSKGSRL